MFEMKILPTTARERRIRQSQRDGKRVAVRVSSFIPLMEKREPEMEGLVQSLMM